MTNADEYNKWKEWQCWHIHCIRWNTMSTEIRISYRKIVRNKT